MSSDPERLREALQIAADLVARDGEAWLPAFMRLEREAREVEGMENALDRARRMANRAA